MVFMECEQFGYELRLCFDSRKLMQNNNVKSFKINGAQLQVVHLSMSIPPPKYGVGGDWVGI